MSSVDAGTCSTGDIGGAGLDAGGFDSALSDAASACNDTDPSGATPGDTPADAAAGETGWDDGDWGGGWDTDPADPDATDPTNAEDADPGLAAPAEPAQDTLAQDETFGPAMPDLAELDTYGPPMPDVAQPDPYGRVAPEAFGPPAPSPALMAAGAVAAAPSMVQAIPDRAFPGTGLLDEAAGWAARNLPGAAARALGGLAGALVPSPAGPSTQTGQVAGFDFSYNPAETTVALSRQDPLTGERTGLRAAVDLDGALRGPDGRVVGQLSPDGQGFAIDPDAVAAAMSAAPQAPTVVSTPIPEPAPPLPGFTPADPLPALPGFTPAPPAPPLPGFTPVAPAPSIVNSEEAADILAPGGEPIGTRGGSAPVRELPGGLPAAEEMFDRLAQGGRVVTPEGYPGTMVELPNGGRIGLRPASESGPPTIDVNIPGLRGVVDKLKFLD